MTRRLAPVLLIAILAACGTTGTESESTNGDSTTQSAPTETEAATTTTAAATTTTKAPTTTVAPTTLPTTTLPPTPVIFSGSGDDVVDLGSNDRFVVHATHTGSRNFIVHALDANLQDVDGVFNEIGAYDGSRPVSSFGDPSEVRYLQVEADGAWTLELLGLDQLLEVTDPFTGAGDAVVMYMGSAGIFTIAHDGQRNFIVHVITADSSDGLINEIGPYTGKQPMPAGPAIVEIQADGNWAFGTTA